MAIAGFDSQPRTRLVYGVDTIDRLGELAASLSSGTVLIVTDAGIVKCGHVERAIRSLRRAGLEVVVFDSVHENPTTRDVDACVEAAREAKIDLLIGLGGGSSMDTAKGCNFLLTNGGRMQDYWGTGRATKEMLPLIAVPTTAGTGSECQSFALISDEDTHQKMACGDPKAAARVAILDPTLTLSQPRGVTACTGIDAIAHAVETAVSRKRTEFSLIYSHEAFRLTMKSLPIVLGNPADLAARAEMQLGAAFAGIAIENSMLGAAHSAANPLTAHFGVAHGQAVGMMLPHVVRFNSADAATTVAYARLAEAAGLNVDASNAAEQLALRLEALLELAEMPRSLGAFAVDSGSLPQLAEEAAGQWTAQFNPRAVTATDFADMYKRALA